MAQLNFLLNKDDTVTLLNVCFQSGCVLIPSIHYDFEDYIVLNNVNDFMFFKKPVSLFLIVQQKYLMSPLRMDFFIDSLGQKKYYIVQRVGGPTIEFLSSFSTKIPKEIKYGFISIYPFFYDNDNNKIKPKQEVVELYKKFISVIKKNSNQIIFIKRKYWVGEMTLQEAIAKKIKLPPDFQT